MPVTLPLSAMHPLRLQPVADGDAVGGRQILLELRGVHLLLAAAVADRHLLGAEQLRLHRGVDRRHAAADDDDAPADRQRRKILAWRSSAMKSTALSTPSAASPSARSALTPPSPMPRNTAS